MGTEFTSTTSVTFNGTTQTTLTVDSNTQITTTVPTGATTGPIIVTNGERTQRGERHQLHRDPGRRPDHHVVHADERRDRHGR